MMLKFSKSLDRHSHGVAFFAWSPDSTKLAVCGPEESDEVIKISAIFVYIFWKRKVATWGTKSFCYVWNSQDIKRPSVKFNLLHTTVKIFMILLWDIQLPPNMINLLLVVLCLFVISLKKCYCYLMAIFRANSFGFFVTATAGTPTTTTRAPRMPPGSGGSSGRHRVHRNRAFLGPFVGWLF